MSIRADAVGPRIGAVAVVVVVVGGGAALAGGAGDRRELPRRIRLFLLAEEAEEVDAARAGACGGREMGA